MRLRCIGSCEATVGELDAAITAFVPLLAPYGFW
jgi:hypothetical protein